MSDQLTNDELTIAKYQSAIRKAGWQWDERVFNDGEISDCMIELTQDKHCLALIGGKRPDGLSETIGWGRFSRLYCWQCAYDTIVRKAAAAGAAMDELRKGSV
jgi:hypothetical protein